MTEQGKIDGTVLHRIGDHMAVVAGDAGEQIVCTRCGHVYGPKQRDPKLGAVAREVPITATSELNQYGAVDELIIRQFFCPSCGTMIAANVQRPGDPVLLETELA